jgi:hypothetical protein
MRFFSMKQNRKVSGLEPTATSRFLVVGRSQGRWLEASGVQVGEIRASVDAFGLCLFD